MEAHMGVRLLGRAMLGQTVVAAIIYGFVGTDKSKLGNFGPDRSLFGKVVEVLRLIRSHKTRPKVGLDQRLSMNGLIG